jgi:hypothetical protein
MESFMALHNLRIRSWQQRWRRALVLFASIFILAIITQFGIAWYQRGATVRESLQASAKEISSYLDYAARWNPKRYRQADTSAGSYVIIDHNGRSIDIQGFVPPMESLVVSDVLRNGFQTFKVPETGETWRLLVKQLQDGTVILGVSSPEDITNVDKRLKENIKGFGSTLKTALLARENKASKVDTYIDIAVINTNHNLIYAVGGIPLRILPHPYNKLSKVFTDGTTYAVYSLPVHDTTGISVGTIITFEKLPPQPWLILHEWLVKCLSSVVIAFFGTLIGIPYIGIKFDPYRLLNEALQIGESPTVEFKESLRWDKWQGTQPLMDDTKKKPSEIRSVSEGIAVKNVAAFLNSKTGGALFIGVADDKSIMGLERDYETLKKTGELRGDRYKDRDQFQLHLRELLAGRIARDINNLYIQTAVVEANGKDVCVVHASPASMPVYLSDAKGKALYVRDGASTVALDVEQTVEYVEQRWPKTLWRRVWNILHTWR